MSILFISDLHLSDESPALLERFKHFIQEDAKDASELYILGDLFEAWVGDDDNSHTANTVALLLRNLSSNGCVIEYIHGNRDFLLGHNYANRCGMRLRSDPYPLTLDRYRLLLCHGDMLCTQDNEYQRFRSIAQNPWVQRLFLALPRFLRERIGGQLRKASLHAGKGKHESIMDVSIAAVDSMMGTARADVLIHGHTHRPDTHQYSNYTRYVLGAWDINPVYLKYDGKFSLENL
jgi:UDP-2,3-diacylglucosamine hydrolase